MKQHLLHLYDDADFMIDRVVSFLKDGALAGESLVVIGTPEHRAAVGAGLEGCDERLVTRDAQELLDLVMRGDRVESVLFERHVGGLFEEAARRGSGQVRGFGEMVALLWQDGNQDAAVRLEHLWSKLSGSERYSLMCAYPLASVADDLHQPPFIAICDGHSHVFSKGAVPSGSMKHRIELLEREANSLRAELTRRLDVQHAMSQTDENKDDFIAILSHELRNPLTPILAAVDMFKKTTSPDHKQRLIDTIGRQTNILARLVEDLLEARHITKGHISIQAAPLRLKDVLEQAAETSGPHIEARDQTLWVECSADIHIRGDAVRLTQALANLLNNAGKFTPRGGTIALTAEQDDGTVRIEVRDSGRGMDPEFLGRAFEPYAQAAVGEGGLGLGLSIVRSIVRLHDGMITATSPGLGLGTTFTITLPVEDAPRTARNPVVIEGQGANVLIVDDNDDVRETLAALLAAYGHRARTAASGQDALQQLEHQPDVVVLDLGMPDMDGFEVARRIRQRSLHPILVALSGHANGRAVAAGFDHQLSKPPDLDRLLSIIGNARPRIEAE